MEESPSSRYSRTNRGYLFVPEVPNSKKFSPQVAPWRKSRGSGNRDGTSRLTITSTQTFRLDSKFWKFSGPRRGKSGSDESLPEHNLGSGIGPGILPRLHSGAGRVRSLRPQQTVHQAERCLGHRTDGHCRPPHDRKCTFSYFFLNFYHIFRHLEPELP